MFHLNYGKVPAERVLDEMEIFAHEVMPAFAGDARATAPASA
jgi:hypothetical protein